MFARLTALFLLTFGLFKTLLLRFKTERSLLVFAQHYGSEGISAVTTEEAKQLAQAGRCTACGRCDAFEGERVANSQSGYRGMMAFALAGARSLTDYAHTAQTIAEVPDEAFRTAAGQCPESVPLFSLAQLVRKHSARGKAALV